MTSTILANTTAIADTMTSAYVARSSSWSSFFLKALITFIIALNYKVIPFKWTLHFYYYVIKYLVIRPMLKKKPKNSGKRILSSGSKSTDVDNKLDSSDSDNPSSSSSVSTAVPTPISSPRSEADQYLFYANSYYTRAVPMECDINGHKSNSTYFTDLDLARSDLLIDILDASFAYYRKNNGRYPYVPLGSVSCIFKREIKPFQRYVIRSRILGWDSKWVFVISRFEFVPPKGEPASARSKSECKAFPSNEKRGKLAAIGLSKYVFKLGRKTIDPEEFFSHSEERLGITEEDYKQGRMDFERAKGIVEAEANTTDMELF